MFVLWQLTAPALLACNHRPHDASIPSLFMWLHTAQTEQPQILLPAACVLLPLAAACCLALCPQRDFQMLYTCG